MFLPSASGMLPALATQRRSGLPSHRVSRSRGLWTILGEVREPEVREDLALVATAIQVQFTNGRAKERVIVEFMALRFRWPASRTRRRLATLVDLGILLCYWLYTEDVTRRAGWFGREEILDRYAARSKRPVDNVALYEVFAVFKLAVVLQQIYARFVRGQTDDPRFATLGDRVKLLAEKSASLAGELG